jgi:hypothetical protein
VRSDHCCDRRPENARKSQRRMFVFTDIHTHERRKRCEKNIKIIKQKKTESN